MSTMLSSVDEKDCKIMYKNYIIMMGLLNIAVIFTGLGFYGVVKMQRYL